MTPSRKSTTSVASGWLHAFEASGLKRVGTSVELCSQSPRYLLPSQDGLGFPDQMGGWLGEPSVLDEFLAEYPCTWETDPQVVASVVGTVFAHVNPPETADVMRVLTEELAGVATVTTRPVVGDEATAVGYCIEPIGLPGAPGAAALEVVGTPGDWLMFVEDGQMETGREETADLELEHAVWGVVALGMTRWRSLGSFWVIDVLALGPPYAAPRFARQIDARVPYHPGLRDRIPARLTTDGFRRVRFTR